MTTTPEEAAKRIERERYIGSQFVADARTVARAYLDLLAEREAGREAVIEECAKVAHDVSHAGAAPAWNVACRRIADAIRALSRPQREGEE